MQSAMNALNPVLSIGAQLRDAMAAHERVPAAQMRQRSEEVLRLVGIDPIHLTSYPHQLSGGMRQRAMIAMALVFRPDLIIMDEPTSALDVVAQRSLMRRVKALQEEFGFAVVFVTHDMSLVSHYSEVTIAAVAWVSSEVNRSSTASRSPICPKTVDIDRSGCHTQLHRLAATTWLSSSDFALA
jgi:peptide/nickel transport system ATP-binding protein